MVESPVNACKSEARIRDRTSRDERPQRQCDLLPVTWPKRIGLCYASQDNALPLILFGAVVVGPKKAD